MSEKMPDGNINFIENTNIFTTTFIQNYDYENEDTGYFIECDLQYPEKIHDLHNDYPIAPEYLV